VRLSLKGCSQARAIGDQPARLKARIEELRPTDAKTTTSQGASTSFRLISVTPKRPGIPQGNSTGPLAEATDFIKYHRRTPFMKWCRTKFTHSNQEIRSSRPRPHRERQPDSAPSAATRNSMARRSGSEGSIGHSPPGPEGQRHRSERSRIPFAPAFSHNRPINDTVIC
jgi:hypothetical protein